VDWPGELGESVFHHVDNAGVRAAVTFVVLAHDRVRQLASSYSRAEYYKPLPPNVNASVAFIHNMLFLD
jgi:hypothetical protein